MCQAQSFFKPSVQIKRVHLREIQQGKITISCVVEAPDNTEVSWFTDNVSKKTTKEDKDLSNNIVSNLTLSRVEWLTFGAVVCTAKHPCFPEEKDEIPVSYVKKDPTVAIRRQTSSAVLECVVSGLPSGEVCFTFQVNNIDISDLSCVDCAPSENIWFLTKHYTIPIEHQKNGKAFTCKVYSFFQSWTSQPIENIFDVAIMELTVVPGQSSSDSQKLLCSVTGFDPKIKWFSQNREKNGRALDVTVMDDGRVKAYSEIMVPQQEWNQEYTCQAVNGQSRTSAEKSTSVCAAQSFFKPSVQIKRVHLREIQQGKITISCVVEAPDNTKVSWFTDNVSKKTTNEVKEPPNNIVSNLTLSRNEWLNLRTVVCTAKHPCFPEERDKIPVGYVKKDPAVAIRRQTSSAVLECVVSGLPSGEVCITFQVNNIDISDLSCVDCAPSENIWFLTKHYTIPIEHQKNGKAFTCKVYSFFQSWTSQPIENIFDGPIVALTVVPGQSSSDSQKLLCSVTGFDPKIKWFSQNREKNGRALDVTVMDDGRVKAYSEILVPQQEWNQEYTCQAVNGQSQITARKSTRVCAAQSFFKPSVQIKRVHLREIQQGKITISCVVEAPDNTKVSWFTDNVSKKTTNEVKDPPNNIVSNLTLSRNEWLNLRTVVCTAKHPCFPEEKDEIPVGYVKKDPAVAIRRQTSSAVLECVVSGLPSGEVCITFQANNIDISDLSCVDCAPSKNIWFLTKHYTIPIEHQKNGKAFTCKVYSFFQSWTSQPIENLFDGPIVALTVVPGQSSSDSQKLLCSVTGFDPKIKWFSQNREKNGRALDVTVMDDGRVKAYSEILVPQQEWNQEYTCQAVNRQSQITAWKSTRVCAAQSFFKPSVQIKRVHLREIQQGKITISCVVEAPDNTKVSWFTDNVSKKNTNEVKDPPNNIVSNLTLSRNEWLNLRTVVCTAKHPCFPEEKDEIPVGYVKKDPAVAIRRQTSSAVLECVVSGLSSGEVCITLQANNIDISDLSCVDCAPSENIWSLTTPLTIPIEHQKNGKAFTCKVYSFFQSWTSQPIKNLFDGPIVALTVVPGQSSSDSQKLLCSVTGFDPKIKWFSQNREKNGRALDVTVMDDGRVKAYSEILVPQQEWNQEYTCQAVNGQSQITAGKSTRVCAVIAPRSQQAGVYLLGPSLSYVRSTSDVILTCLVFGQSVKLFSIKWKVNGKFREGFGQNPKDHNNGTESTENILKVSVKEWNRFAVFTCEVKHLCSNNILQKNISKTQDPKQPTVRILRPSDSDLSGLQNANLLCLITGFFPSDISVRWQLNGTELDASQFSNSPVVNDTSGGFAMHSALMLPVSKRKDGVFSCVVVHESSRNPITTSIKNLYASVTGTAPSAKLLQGDSELVCLVFGFSPPAINITWFRGTTEVSAHRVSDPAKGPDGKFSIQSHLDLQPSDWAPGEVYTCKVTHLAGNVSCGISKTAAFSEEALFINENKPDAIAQDTVEETWKMACAFLALFLLSLFYGCTVTLVKVKTA